MNERAPCCRRFSPTLHPFFFLIRTEGEARRLVSTFDVWQVLDHWIETNITTNTIATVTSAGNVTVITVAAFLAICISGRIHLIVVRLAEIVARYLRYVWLWVLLLHYHKRLGMTPRRAMAAREMRTS